MVDSLYKQYKLHVNIASGTVAKVGMLLSEKAAVEDFLPFPQSNQKNNQLPISKETARIFLELRSQGVIPPRVLGAFTDIEENLI